MTEELEESTKGDTKEPEQEDTGEEDLAEESEGETSAEENADEDPGAGRQDAIDVTFYDSEGKAVKLPIFTENRW